VTEFLQRLRERKLVQWAVAYAAAAFALLQGIDIIAAKFGWPESFERILIIALCIGFFVTSIALPAWTMLLYWAAIQFVSGLFGLLASDRGGVAFWAHVGGFVAGVVLIKLFARSDYVVAHRRHHWEPRRLVGR